MLNNRITRRDLLKSSLATLAAAPFLGSAAQSLAADKPPAKRETFKLCINLDERGEHSPTEIAPGWDTVEIPLSPIVKPFSTEEEWKETKARILSWKLPPIKTCGFFNEGVIREQPGLPAGKKSLIGPNEDFEREKDWAKRSFARLEELGVEVAGLWGSHFRVPEGFDRNKATDQALRYVEMLGKAARPHKIRIVLEPTADPTTVFPKYTEGVAFAKRIGMPEVRVMADINYFIKGNWDYKDIAIDPDYCLHCHIANKSAQPGKVEGEDDRTELFLKLFAVLRDIGYTRSVCAACPWVSTTGGKLDYRAETAKCLKYLQNLRTKTYEG